MAPADQVSYRDKLKMDKHSRASEPDDAEAVITAKRDPELPAVTVFWSTDWCLWPPTTPEACSSLFSTDRVANS